MEIFLIDYDADASFWNAAVNWFITERLVLGGSLRSYDNRGSFALDRDDLALYADLALGGDYTIQLSYRDVEYEEDQFDAYVAEFAEVGLRLNW